MKQPNLVSRIAWRLQGYKQWLQMDNSVIGRCVELSGDRIALDGMHFSVRNPLIHTAHKSTILFGIYEVPEREFVQRHVHPTDSVVELGGSIGVVSCTINRILDVPTRHVVVEANPTLIPTLELNRRLNDAQFEVVHALVGYGSTFGSFTSTGHFLTGSVSAEHGDRVCVRSTDLGTLIAQLGNSPVVLVSDIEGSEVELVENELTTIQEQVSTIIMETHPGEIGADRTRAMLRRLAEAGLQEVERNGDVVVLNNVHMRTTPRSSPLQS